ncbi:MAG: large conductance mechanosensitive channel protein MscL [Oscillospiraceae bacterium]|nr:large conductance mechanosensitive channel protein MscL [Oscillospiraceae bacterium]
MEEKKGFIAEFKEFIARGNVMDLAVGVIVGGAFSAITTSLINDIIMPLLGIFTGSISFAALSVTIGGAVITYGNFIQALLNFLVMAFIVFCMVKAVNKMTHLKKEEEEAPAPAEPEAPPAPTTEELLAAILEELKKDK